MSAKEFKYIKDIADAIHGKISLAVHVPSQTEVAIKSVNTALIAECLQKSTTENIATEIQQGRRFTGVPFCVSLFGTYEDGDKTRIVLEYAPNGDLFDMLGKVSVDDARLFTAELLTALAHVHEAGYAHRDVSLENIFLSGRSVRLADFAQCVRCVDRLGNNVYHEGICGKNYFRAPEVYSGRYEARAIDIFACGVVLFMLLTGIPPWKRACVTDDSRFKFVVSEGIGALVNAWNLTSVVPPDALEVLTEMLAIDPHQRPSALQALRKPFFSSAIPTVKELAAVKVSNPIASFKKPMPSTSASTTTASTPNQQERYMNIQPQVLPTISSTYMSVSSGNDSAVPRSSSNSSSHYSYNTASNSSSKTIKNASNVQHHTPSAAKLQLPINAISTPNSNTIYNNSNMNFNGNTSRYVTSTSNGGMVMSYCKVQPDNQTTSSQTTTASVSGMTSGVSESCGSAAASPTNANLFVPSNLLGFNLNSGNNSSIMSSHSTTPTGMSKSINSGVSLTGVFPPGGDQEDRVCLTPTNKLSSPSSASPFFSKNNTKNHHHLEIEIPIEPSSSQTNFNNNNNGFLSHSPSRSVNGLPLSRVYFQDSASASGRISSNNKMIPRSPSLSAKSNNSNEEEEFTPSPLNNTLEFEEGLTSFSNQKLSHLLYAPVSNGSSASSTRMGGGSPLGFLPPVSKCKNSSNNNNNVKSFQQTSQTSVSSPSCRSIRGSVTGVASEYFAGTPTLNSQSSQKNLLASMTPPPFSPSPPRQTSRMNVTLQSGNGLKHGAASAGPALSTSAGSSSAASFTSPAVSSSSSVFGSMAMALVSNPKIQSNPEALSSLKKVVTCHNSGSYSNSTAFGFNK